MDIEGLSM